MSRPGLFPLQFWVLPRTPQAPFSRARSRGGRGQWPDWELLFEVTWVYRSIPMWGSHRLASGARLRGLPWTLWPGAVLLHSVPHLQALSQHTGMCSPEEAALLQLEEVFSATLARISNRVLQPLLTAGVSHFPGGGGDTGTVLGAGVSPGWASELQLEGTGVLPQQLAAP